MTLLEEIQSIKDRAQKATEGPWHRFGSRIITNCARLGQEVEIVRFVFNLTWPTAKQCEAWSKEQQANLEFIIASRQNVPKLCDALIEAIEAIEDLSSRRGAAEEGVGDETLTRISEILGEE